MKSYKGFITEAELIDEGKKGFWLYRRNPSGVPDKTQDKHGKYDRKKVYRTKGEAQKEADKRNKKTKGNYWTPVSIATVSSSIINEVDSRYIVAKNPHDKKWYAMGHVGSNKWMPVSDGFKSKSEAQKWARSQGKVDKAARGEVGGV